MYTLILLVVEPTTLKYKLIAMDNPTQVNKIVIGKTWVYVFIILLSVIFIYLYRCHHEEPKLFREPE